jgi:hypothetical protein
MTNKTTPPALSPNLITGLTGVAIELRQAFCALLQDEIDVLASNMIELDAVAREVSNATALGRVASVSASLDQLRKEKVRLADRIMCVAIPDPHD